MKRAVVLAALIFVLAGGFLSYQLGLVDWVWGASGGGCKKAQALTAPTLAEVYAFSEGLAKAWKPDAALERVDHLGPLQPNGSATEWSVGFYSAGAKSTMLIHTGDGKLHCNTSHTQPGLIPALKPDFMRDGAALYALAVKHGEVALAKGYTPRLKLYRTVGDPHAMWHITYGKADFSTADVRVVVDANTGALEEVVKQ